MFGGVSFQGCSDLRHYFPLRHEPRKHIAVLFFSLFCSCFLHAKVRARTQCALQTKISALQQWWSFPWHGGALISTIALAGFGLALPGMSEYSCGW